MRGTSIASATPSCLLGPPSAGPSHKPIAHRTPHRGVVDAVVDPNDLRALVACTGGPRWPGWSASRRRVVKNSRPVRSGLGSVRGIASRRRTWVVGWIVLVVLAVGPVEAFARRPVSRAPVLGDWEGVGPHGLPLSFRLARARGRVTIGDLTVGDPLFCPGRLALTDAIEYPQSLYIGPGAPPVLRLGAPRDEITIRVGMGAPFSPELDGRLLGPRNATVSEPVPRPGPRGCGWGSTRRLTWRLAPAKRRPVTAGEWTGTVNVPGGSGTVSVRVARSERTVELFQVAIRCPQGGYDFGVGPATVGEFISAGGVFEDATRPAGFRGRFGPGQTLTGTFHGRTTQGCGSGSLAFAAHPA